jgi:transposase
MKKPVEITHEIGNQARQYIKGNKYPKANMRLLVIALKSEGKTTKEIAEITKFSTRQVLRIVKKCEEKGVKALLEERRGGANNKRVTNKQERRFFKKYKEKAKTGEIITALEMRKEFQEEFGVEITKSGFYRLLKRHGWRKIMPELQHPKSADAKTRRASKKLNLVTENQEKRFTWVVGEEKCV